MFLFLLLFFCYVHLSQVVGLEGCSFQDHLNGMKVSKEDGKFVSFQSEVDRTYLSVPRELSIGDGSK